MRVTAGALGGRLFASPGTRRTHPMSDKVRGALFNALGDIEGLTVFDPFAGSGAISFEAISRGAASAVALDNDKTAFVTLRSNIISLGLSNQVKATHTGAAAWLKTQPAAQFDIVICDPPYDTIKADLLRQLAQRAVVGGLVVLSLPPKFVFSLPDNFNLLSFKEYGDATLAFYRRVE